MQARSACSASQSMPARRSGTHGFSLTSTDCSFASGAQLRVDPCSADGLSSSSDANTLEPCMGCQQHPIVARGKVGALGVVVLLSRQSTHATPAARLPRGLRGLRRVRQLPTKCPAASAAPRRRAHAGGPTPCVAATGQLPPPLPRRTCQLRRLSRCQRRQPLRPCVHEIFASGLPKGAVRDQRLETSALRQALARAKQAEAGLLQHPVGHVAESAQQSCSF